MLFQSVCGHLIFSVRYHFSAVRNTLILSDFRITILLHFHTIKHSDLFDLTSFYFSSPFPQCTTFSLPALHPTPSPSTRNVWSQDAITRTYKSQDQATSNVLLFSFSVYLSTFALEELLDSEFWLYCLWYKVFGTSGTRNENRETSKQIRKSKV